MDGLGFVFIDAVGVVLGLIIFLIVIALGGWFGFAVGSALGSQFGGEKDSEDSGGFFGMLVGLSDQRRPPIAKFLGSGLCTRHLEISSKVRKVPL